MKRNLLLLTILVSYSVLSQNKMPYTFGKITQAENDLTVYEKDSTANAIFLNEYGKTTFHETNRSIVIRTKYYGKVKIFNKEGVEHATIKIPIYNNGDAREKIRKIRAITHNGIVKTGLDKKNIFTEKINDHWSEVKFTMPNIKDNSIIEYEYTLESPFKFNFKGWEFQDDIPKLFSEFYALIPGNYIYNRRLIGYQNLDKNIADLKKHCFSVTGYAGDADCEELTYAMKDVPAFIKEDYMTARENYIASIKFELSELHWFDGAKYKYTKSWKDVDKEFKIEKSIGKQLRKIDNIKKQLPIQLLEGEINLAKAKSIYNYIKDHFSWNNKSRLFTEVNVKNAFSERIGNSTEINIALINALNAAGFDANAMLISTRQNGLPTKAHPVMSDFNYAIAKLNIGAETFLLDATNKAMPFGMLPFKCLNGYGRVMDFKNSSYWFNIVPKKNNQIRTSLKLKMNEEGDFEGQMHKSYDGYNGIEKRNEINSSSDEDDYLTQMEEKYGVNDQLIIDSYKNFNFDNINKPIKELYDITVESGLDNNLLIFNPFISSKSTSNPFKLKERTYPVDFGYAKTTQFNLQLDIPVNYNIKTLPEKAAFQLPNEGGSFIFDIKQKENQITMIVRVVINRSYFLPEEYPYLKEFFNQIIKSQKSLITLEKIN